MTTPAGWYDDGSGRLRWWDGSAWTEHTMDAVPPSPAQTTPHESVVEPGSSAGITPSSGSGSGSGSEPEIPTFTPPYAAQESAPWATPATAASQPAAPTGGHAASAASYPGAPATAAAVPLDPYAPRPAAAKRRTSVLGIIGLTLATLGVVLSCIPAIAIIGWILLGVGFVTSLVSLFLPGARWAGIAGLAVGVLGAVLALAVALLTFAAAESPADEPAPAATEKPVPSDEPSREPSPSAEATPPPGAETVTFDELAVGQCIPFMEWGDEVYELPIVPCDQPHTDEVYYIFDADDGDYPGDDALQTLATERCDTAFAEYVGIPYKDSTLDNYWFVPTEASWNRLDDRTIQCIVYSNDEVTESFQGSAR